MIPLLSPRPSSAAPRLRARRGFTVVELVVAIIIITVGLLALAAGSGATIRQMELSQQQSSAALIAQSRMEQFRAISACSGFASGSTTVNALYTDKWTVTTYAANKPARTVAETVSYKDRYGKTKKFGVVSVMPCQ